MGTIQNKLPFGLSVGTVLIIIVWIFAAGGAWKTAMDADTKSLIAIKKATENERCISVLENTQKMNMAEQARRFNAIDAGIEKLSNKIDKLP